MRKATKPRIVLVTAQRTTATLISTALNKAGYAVVLAASGEEAYHKIVRKMPQGVITDITLPRMDGVALCKLLRRNPFTCLLPVVLLIPDATLVSLGASADDYLIVPCQPQEVVVRITNLIARVQNLDQYQIESESHTSGRTLAIFAGKGGVGKTTLTVNLAIALRGSLARQVTIFDADFAFGDVGLHLALPATSSVVDLIQPGADCDLALVAQTMLLHASGVHVLLNPSNPAEAELITPTHVEMVLELLARLSDYVIIDCPPTYDERTLAILAHADDILLVVTPEIGAIKNTSHFLDMISHLGIDSKKILLVLNRANSDVGLDVKGIERTLRHPIAFQLSSGGRDIVASTNRGIPLLYDQPDHRWAREIGQIATSLLSMQKNQAGRSTTLRSRVSAIYKKLMHTTSMRRP
jgi:pilus assembly protein CpaE